jgi:hypothetical protein
MFTILLNAFTYHSLRACCFAIKQKNFKTYIIVGLFRPLQISEFGTSYQIVPCNENPICVFIDKELRGPSPHFPHECV